MNGHTLDDAEVEQARETWKGLVDAGPLDQETIMQRYAKWAHRYDVDIALLKTKGVSGIAELLDRKVPDLRQRPKLRLLDLASGTGRLGPYLKEMGFVHFDALDGCQEMLDQLKARNLYSNIYCVFVTAGQKIEAIPDATYDIVVIAGGFCQTHLPIFTLREVARMLKPAGLFLNRLTESYLHYDDLRDLEPTMKQMEDEGVWRKVERITSGNDIAGMTGVYHVYEKL